MGGMGGGGGGPPTGGVKMLSLIVTSSRTAFDCSWQEAFPEQSSFPPMRLHPNTHALALSLQVTLPPITTVGGGTVSWGSPGGGFAGAGPTPWKVAEVGGEVWVQFVMLTFPRTMIRCGR